MKINLILPAVLILTLASCTDHHTPDKPIAVIPKALEDKSSLFDYSGRGYGNLVEDLYRELLDKDPELQQLEEKIQTLQKNRTDSTALFERFNGKNQAYFSSANYHVSAIKDSVLREQMLALIAGNIEKYHASMAKHSALMQTIAANGTTASDLHNMLKIVRTLPLMEKFQQDHLPGTASLEGHIKQQDETIRFAGAVTKN